MKQNKSTQGKQKASHSNSSSAKYKIYLTANFYEEAKKLAKKYHNLREDLFGLRDQLRGDPISGNPHHGDGVYKVRMAITDKNKGQSAGARIMIKVYPEAKRVYVLSIYDKSVSDILVDSTIAFFRKWKLFFFIFFR